ncbi:MAG: hypothetical protein E7174_02190 [Firmicutes bacterium]|nr:hypothetical protein [Bacillota bacterium]
MIVKAIYKDGNNNYFRDKTTAKEIHNQTKRYYGDIFECDDEIAKERIKNGLVEKATKQEIKKFKEENK